MSCINPLQGVRDLEPNANGKYPLIFNPSHVSKHSGRDVLTVPCMRCIPCRLKHSSDWAFRMMCEGRTFDNCYNCSFITLTYSPENLPDGGTLVLEHFQDFMKRLRSKLDYDFGVKIRFFHSGEYGDKYKRAHYHAIIFGWNFPDRYFFKRVPSGFDIFRSPLLESCWSFGHSSVGEMTFESCAYVARYVVKKVTGSMAQSHYERILPDSGEVFNVKPEYCTMSRMPGIGKSWFLSNYKDIYPKDFMTFNRGRKIMPPKYFDELYRVVDPNGYDLVKQNRIIKAQYNEPFSYSRAESIEKCFKQRIGLLVRALE